ncbi:uncharacterized protein B0H18DRAFT_1018935 [Fomitopsis serialis]|uniref:uncharacterized protein n=1 Tax=Fomitopsis serialis TaxID=139415 RepID=UPI0020078342|nr:uncharacterized protein B0H18DRAFT_1018935 [Neoantrodia serialis]KAH9922057.1 hypothetical protein B0H18DRAFT_1018935 [Neoantrodia serialis]
MVHQALTTPELVRMIVDEAGSGWPGWSLDLPTLLSLALVCRVFHEPALDNLWFHQNGLHNVVNCLPTELWKMTNDASGRLVQTLRAPTRPTTQQDWERFDFYARRVGVLQFNSNGVVGRRRRPVPGQLTEKLFRWLFSSRPSHQLLPSLSSLYWTELIPLEYSDSVHLLIGRRLSELYIRPAWTAGITAFHAIHTTLLHLPQCSPGVRKLEVDMPLDRDPVLHSIPGKALMSLKRLEILTLRSASPVTFDILAELSALPDLMTLTLSEFNYRQAVVNDMGVGHAASTTLFRALKSLRLSASSMTDIDTVLSACRFVQLQQIFLTSKYAFDESKTLGSVLQSVHECCSNATLETVEIFDGTSADPDEDSADVTQPITAASFRHLYDFHHLRSFILNTENCIVLDDDAVHEMAMSWPHLECLQLFSSPKYPWRIPTATTLEGLAHLARYCPLLSTLIFDVDTSNAVVSPDVKPGGGYCNRVLRTIGCFRSPVSGDPAQIGAFLYAIFPNLEAINEEEEIEMDDSWEPVVGTIEVLRIASQWEKKYGAPPTD